MARAGDAAGTQGEQPDAQVDDKCPRHEESLAAAARADRRRLRRHACAGVDATRGAARVRHAARQLHDGARRRVRRLPERAVRHDDRARRRPRRARVAVDAGRGEQRRGLPAQPTRVRVRVRRDLHAPAVHLLLSDGRRPLRTLCGKRRRDGRWLANSDRCWWWWVHAPLRLLCRRRCLMPWRVQHWRRWWQWRLEEGLVVIVRKRCLLLLLRLRRQRGGLAAAAESEGVQVEHAAAARRRRRGRRRRRRRAVLPVGLPVRPHPRPL